MVCIYLDEEMYIFQLFYAIFSQLWFISYLITYQPQIEHSENMLEIFTETCIMVFIYTMMYFTDFVPLAKLRYDIGNVTISIFFLNMFVNFLAVFLGLLAPLKNYIKGKCKGKCVKS